MALKATILDGLNLMNKLGRPHRVWNAIKVLFSYYHSKATGKNQHRGMPVSVSVEPTTSCNLRCPQCPSGLRSFTRDTGMLSENFFQKFTNEIYQKTGYMILYFQGEPYLNNQFLDMVNYARQKKIYTATSTNAHYLNEKNAKLTVESGLDRIIISIDGTDDAAYEKYRIGGKLHKVLEGTKNLVAAKKELKKRTPYIIWQFVVFSHNEHQIPEIKRMTKEFGVDHLALKSAQIYDFENDTDLLPKNSKYSRYAIEQNKLSIKSGLANHCWRMWHSCVVTWDGNVVPCCFDKDATFNLGNLNQNKFESVWKGETYSNFRKLLLKGRKEIDICKNCSEGLKVWV